MRKRVLSLLLVFCMAVSLLPGAAYAAVGELLENTPKQNESLLEQLESFTGESYEEAYELLDTLGLLDEDENLVTDQTILLDGKEYTLDQIEALLDAPGIDLTQVAEVDGVPIALGDLKTIISIERELQYLQEKYFSGRTFEGEALENINSLLAQLQSGGLILSAPYSAGDDVILNTTGEGQLSGYTCYYISTANSNRPEQDDTFSVKFKLAVPDAIKKMGTVDILVSLASGTNGNSQTVLDSKTISSASADPNMVYTLTYTVDDKWTDYKNLYLGVTYQMGALNIDIQNLHNYYDNSFGTLSGGVSFYEPEGFFFGDQSGNKLENWNLYFDYQFTLPELPSSWIAAEERQSTTINSNGAEFHLGDATDTGYAALDKVYGLLQACKDNPGTDKMQRFQVSATIQQTNQDSTALMSSAELFHEANTNSNNGNQFYNFVVDIPTADEFPLTLNSGSTATISFRAYNGNPGEAAVEYLPTAFLIPFGEDANVTTAGNNQENLLSVVGVTTTTSDVTVELVDHEVDSKPTLTITAPEGNYQSGDLIPITLTGNEYIQASANATITINSTEYNLSDLHASTSGKFISLLYKVKDADAANLLISGVSGITDFFGNSAKEVNQTVQNVQLTSVLMKNAVTGLTADYANGGVNFTITANQDEQYKTVYGQYVNTPTELMRLLISKDGGQGEPYIVTMSEGADDSFAFIAEPYAGTQ